MNLNVQGLYCSAAEDCIVMKVLRGHFSYTGSKWRQMIQEVGKLTSFQELYSFFGKALITKAQSRKKKKNTAAVSHTNSTSETLTGIYEDRLLSLRNNSYCQMFKRNYNFA